jgi:hypothetical protein
MQPKPGKHSCEERETKAASSAEQDLKVFDAFGHLLSKQPNMFWRTKSWRTILRKEVIQPQVPLRLPCYDFTPVADPTVVCCPLAVGAQPSGKTNSHGVTGGVYKARERIHRGMLFRDY